MTLTKHLDRKEVGNPPVDVVVSLLANLQDVQKLLSDIREYIEDVQRVSVSMKGIALVQANMHAYISAQSAIDVVKDVQDLIDGKKITTIAEMQEKLRAEEEAMEKKLKGDAQEAYTY